MPESVLQLGPNSFNVWGVSLVIAKFLKLRRAKEYLDTCRGGVIFVTDNPENLSKPNQDQLKLEGVSVVGGKLVRSVPPGYAASAQGKSQNVPGVQQYIWLDLENPYTHKDPLNI